jgi:hypothetical protein
MGGENPRSKEGGKWMKRDDSQETGYFVVFYCVVISEQSFVLVKRRRG